METFKTWFEVTIFNNTVKDYALAGFNLVALVIILMLTKKLAIGRLKRLAAKTVNDFDDFLVGLLDRVGAPVFIAATLYVVTLPLHLEDQVRNVIRSAAVIVLTFQAVYILQDIIKYGIRKSYRKSGTDSAADSAVIKNLSNVVGWAVWALGLVFVLDNLGINISTLVAGLGIGGIAVALAAQAVLGDLFSALSIFVDKPFEVGDFIIVDGLMGTVEYVGLKTTRIRSLSGEQLILSNSDLTKSRIKNYKRMETRRIAFKIGVVYQTPLDKAKKIPGLIKEIFARVDGVRLDRVHFESFGDFSLNYEIVHFVQSSDYNVYMDRQQQINFLIKEVFEREGVDFAYPTQTLFVPQMPAR